MPDTVRRKLLLLELSTFWARSDTRHSRGLLAGHIHPSKGEEHVKARVSLTSWVGNCILIEQASFDDVSLILLLEHKTKDCNLKI